jgi:hypothetical protein
MNETLALGKIRATIAHLDEYGAVFDIRWAGAGIGQTRDDLHPRLMKLEDDVRRECRMCSDIAIAMGEPVLASQVSEHHEGLYSGHPWQKARASLVELEGVLSQREQLSDILGPTGPKLEATSLHPTIWTSAAALWDGGHSRAAVQTAAQALEGLLQSITAPQLSGERLAAVFSLSDATSDSPRLRLRDIDPASTTWRSAHEGMAALVRGAFMAVRNLVSHPGWPEPQPDEALEMLALMSYVVHMIDRSDVVRANA